MVKALVGLVALGCAAALLGGMTGAIWAFGDSLAVGRIPATAGMALSALLFWAWQARLWAGLSAALALAALVTLWAPAPAPGPDPEAQITIYQKNILFRGLSVTAQAEDILSQGAEVVTLQEVLPEMHPLRQRLRSTHPFQAWCPFSGVGGTAVLSRYPFLQPPQCWHGATVAQVDSPVGPLWIVSVHLIWPAPYGQAAQVAGMAEQLAALEGPIVLSGDFNMVAWGHSPRLLRRASGTRRHGGPLGTLPILRHARLGEGLWPALPIDHIFPPKDWGATLERRPRIGSDHMGLVMRLASR